MNEREAQIFDDVISELKEYYWQLKREAQIFDDVISELKEYYWQLNMNVIVDSLRTDFHVEDTDNAYERARDWVKDQLDHIYPDAAEVIADHKKKTGETDQQIFNRLIRYYDNYDGPYHLWEALTT